MTTDTGRVDIFVLLEDLLADDCSDTSEEVPADPGLLPGNFVINLAVG